MSKLIRRKASLVVATFLFLVSLAFPTVCRNKGVRGYDESARRAHRVLPPNTSDARKTVIYIENTPDGLYFQSNFVTPGYGFEYPTKIANEKLTDVGLAFMNIRFAEIPNQLAKHLAAQVYRDDVQILLDRSVFSEGGYPLVDVKGAKNVAVVDGRTGELLTNGSVERLDRTSPPPILLSKVLGCCLYGIPPHLAPGYEKALEQRAFNKDNVRFLSLIRDSGTETAIQRSSNLKSVRVGEPGRIDNLSQIESAFKAAQGKTVMMVSHVEDGNFVVRDPAGNVTFSTPIDSVRALAKQYNVELVDLGCQTAQQIQKDSLGLGVTTKFNTVAGVEALERAVSQSRNYSEFFANLTSENLKIVIDNGFMRGWPLCADVYAQNKGFVPVWVKLARIFVSFRQS